MKFLSLALLFVSIAVVNAEETSILLETDTLVLGIGGDGRVTSFVDRLSGRDYCNHAADTAFAVIKQAGNMLHPVMADYEAGRLTVDFDGTGGRVVFNVRKDSRWLSFEVASLACVAAEELVFAKIPLTLRADPAAPFAVSPLAVNLKTNCVEIPGLCSDLGGFMAYKRYGFEGARGMIIACPAAEMRDTLKVALKASPDLVYSLLGGPWALDAKINQGSYLIAAEEYVKEDNVGRWIKAAQSVGATQIDLHGGKAFRWGDFEVNKDIYPRGRQSLKAVVEAIHNAGLAAGLHTYAFFIAKDTPWVTPVPDPDLDTDKEFTLATEVSANDPVLAVNEDTSGMSSVTGFQVRNSATLRIGDEIITYTDVGKESPYAFKGCTRGAYGTRAATHAKGAMVFHLKECFGLFVPRGDSALFTQVAERTADLYNACGFDMLYLDALDGADILAGGSNAWHYSAKFVYELMRLLKRPPVMEMSTFSHHLWCVRSRMQAWDCPSRAGKHFVDCHVASNVQWKNAFLPTHLGWWGVFPWCGVQPERSLPEDLEYLCAKALATDSSLSYITGFSPENMQFENTRRLAEIAREYEDLRLKGVVPGSVKERLATPGEEFTLETTSDGGCRFRPVRYLENTITFGKETKELTIFNPYSEQPLKLRIEVPLCAGGYDSPESRVLSCWESVGGFGQSNTQSGVTATLTQSSGMTVQGEEAAILTAMNESAEPGRAWAIFEHQFEKPLDLNRTGLGVWVHGDGQGAVLNLQLRASMHLAGGFADHYIPLDFKGWRYFSLVEPESDGLSSMEWPHTRRLGDLLANPGGVTAYAYPMYHLWVDYASIASLTLGINNLPAGKTVEARIGPIKALPLLTSKLVNPSITVGGKSLMFPVELESGNYVEFLSMEECRVYKGNGELLGDVRPTGEVPMIAAGSNVWVLESNVEQTDCRRAKVSFMLYGDPLTP